MSVIGNKPATNFQAIRKQTITGTGATAYALDHPVSSPNDIEVFINNVRQEPVTSYNATSQTITFTEAVTSSDSAYMIYQGQTMGTIAHPADQALTATTGTFSGALSGTTGTFTGDVSAPGHVIQMQSNTAAGSGSASTSASYIDTGLSVNITPKFSTSKILVIVHQVVAIDPGNSHTRVDFKCIEAGGTDIYSMFYHGTDGTAGQRIQKNMGGSGVFQCSNTNQLTFKTQIRKANTTESDQYFPLWYTNSIHTIQALEIAQ